MMNVIFDTKILTQPTAMKAFMFATQNSMCEVSFLEQFLWCTESAALYVDSRFVWNKQKEPGRAVSMSKTFIVIIIRLASLKCRNILTSICCWK